MARRRNPEETGTTPEHSNRVVARRFWEATAAGDPETILALFSPDIVWRAHGDNPIAGEYHGPEKVLGYMARLGETVDELRDELDDIFGKDGRTEGREDGQTGGRAEDPPACVPV